MHTELSSTYQSALVNFYVRILTGMSQTFVPRMAVLRSVRAVETPALVRHTGCKAM